MYGYIIGSIFTIAPVDIIYIGVSCALTLLYVICFYRDIFMITFNQEIAMLTERRYRIAKDLFTLLVAINVVITIRAVGLLLVSSMMVIPSLIALRYATSMKQTLLYSSVSSIAALICGTVLALRIDIPPSGAIVLLLLLFFVAAHVCVRIRPLMRR